MRALPDTIGVVGAGTMGAGIAQLAAQAGTRALIYDALPGAAERAISKIEEALLRMVQRGRLDGEEAVLIRGRLVAVGALEELAPCGLVVEAAPEQLELKLELFRALDEVIVSNCVLATNTSSLSVTEIAAGTSQPERVVGLHFFNPAPVMRLVEVVAGECTSPEAIELARTVGEAMGKRVIEAADVAGFLVNRSARPFSLMSLRLLQERVASHQQIDRIARMQGGFRMGPLELMDLVGLDVNHSVAMAFQRQSFGEPRYRPSPIQARMVAAGRLGRKTGSGWYHYAGGTAVGEYRAADPEPPSAGGGEGRAVVFTGPDVHLPVAVELAELAVIAGFDVSRPASSSEGEPWLTLVFGATGADVAAGATGATGATGADVAAGVGPVGGAAAAAGVSGPRARFLHDGSLHALDPEAAGLHVVPPLESAGLIEVTETPRTDPVAIQRLNEFVGALGRVAEPVADAPGLVLGRILCALINEAAFTIGEGHGTPGDIDAGVELGLNHPRGPVAWSHLLGPRHVVTLLDALHRELGEDAYRAAPALRRAFALGAPGL